ncbi:MAG TPA: isoprenylcysteine carboxylmethyltransferase family protein [Thermodesulfovibrionales bacterium]|nr:isoprenylcysteine carboxylmethyltransferase family protein [Thermodesulfovibrionales bacterium]
MNKTKALGNSAIVLYFIIGLEIMIMISPFAGLFYSVFNPFLLEMAKYPSTKWLSSFFLPHLVIPPDDFLKFIRIMGSVLFVLGMAIFFICALQVYTNKFLKKGTALKGLYSIIRHPQYVGLGIAGIGLSILWPRFLVPVLWLVMVLVYYFLAKDEERRMLQQYPGTYRSYMEKTGMFLPQRIEKILIHGGAIGKVVVFALIAALTIGGVFFLRDYTVNRLPLWTGANVSALAIIPDDLMKMEHRMPEVLNLQEVKSKLKDDEHYLVYFLPADYIMQGLIADTGGDWRLYKQHHTISMITDWIFHPFSHLTGGHHAQHGMSGHAMQGNQGVLRRILFLRIENVPINKPTDLFSINARRVAIMMLDVEIHDMDLKNFKELHHDTGWGTVPTPIF